MLQPSDGDGASPPATVPALVPVPQAGSGSAADGGGQPEAEACGPPVFQGGGARRSGRPQDDEDHLILCTAIRELASEAAQIEQTAMELDRAGDAEQAAACYRQAAERLSRAAASCPDGEADRAVLSRHAGEIMGRIVYLESLHGAPAVTPLEEHIGSARLGGPAASGSAHHSLREQAASAAGVAGTAGLLVLHAPLAAVALAAGAAYATTRKDTAGEAARNVGDFGIQTFDKAKTLAEEHKVPEQVSAKASVVIAKACRVALGCVAMRCSVSYPVPPAQSCSVVPCLVPSHPIPFYPVRCCPLLSHRIILYSLTWI